eukprot:gnl/TRDRNA2_/TRDRNA2_189136_c0_seq1.p1 gnl/TRDRNA2_/TRDRNA2_189136_c0~~gnl/TRDRNA2_/TRDRNA2_189136_c0_seq1.p1  ORF type:complete len:140 (+),score=31.83 gnl/TRDRNA2_/TRDRNA2_189136_c0_seq1:54-422(+)
MEGEDGDFDDDAMDDVEDLDEEAEGFDVHEENEVDADKPRKAEGPRKTSPYMTKYERARILGSRALQISMNAPIMVELNGETDPLLIAEKELNDRVVPMVVRRYLPDGTYEDWTVRELLDLE